MLVPSDTNDPADAATPENLVEVGSYDSYAAAFEHGLVVLATGHPYWLLPADAHHRLLVETAIAPVVQRHLASFDRESVGWPPIPVDHAPHGRPVDLLTPLLWALTVLVVYWGETVHPHWITAGALDRDAVFGKHEWWRTFTALFLHADAGHLVSNALNGLMVFAAVVTTLGRARGWLCVAAASVLGNAASVALNFETTYQSIGASTAIFAGIGLLSGRAIRQAVRVTRRHRLRAFFVPFATGFTVLGLYGAGGVHIDVGAHLTGFIAGLVVGILARERSCVAA
jgi:membrane associated rhomboid family serine protease